MGDSNEGRLGNVAGVVVAGDAAGLQVQRAAGLLQRICEQVAIVDRPGLSALAAVAEGLQSVEAERVLMVEASGEEPSATLVLALTAWPESPAVVPELTNTSCGIYVRQAVLPQALARLAAGDGELAGWLTECDAAALDHATLAAISAADR